jgi:hypothetical protein
MQTAPIRQIASLIASAALVAFTVPLHAQTRALTADDYRRAEQFLGYNTNPLVLHAAAAPTWMGDDRFWYRTTTENGVEFFQVEAATGARTPAFDQAKLASALSAAARSNYSSYRLPFNQFEFSSDRKSISFNAGGSLWTCDVEGTHCESKARRQEPPSVTSPDGKRAAFIRNYNLWVRDVASGKETQLTKDGVKEYGYATDNAGWIHSDSPIVLWSPDSKKIATFQQDERGTGDMYLVSTAVGHPKLEAWKYPLPGDPKIFMIERVVIDVERARVVRLQMPPDSHRSSICDDVECNGPFEDVEWSADGRQLAFLSTSRDHKEAHLRVADTENGKVRDVLEEKVSTYFESGNDAHNWRFLPSSNEVIWFSERDNWGQLYLYDLQTGRLKNQITSGEGNVTQLVRVDEKNRLLYFRGVGKEKGRDPYFIHYYRIGFDGKEPDAPDARGRHARRLGVAFGEICRRQLFETGCGSDDGAARCGRQTDRDAGEGRHLPTRRRRLEAAGADCRERQRRHDGSIRTVVQTDQVQRVREVSDHQSHLSGPPDREHGAEKLPVRSRRFSSACGAWIHRGRNRRHGDAMAIEEIPRRIFRRHG